jgi:hypothetical protein
MSVERTTAEPNLFPPHRSYPCLEWLFTSRLGSGFLHLSDGLAVQAGRCLELQGSCAQPLNLGGPGDERIRGEQVQWIACGTEASDKICRAHRRFRQPENEPVDSESVPLGVPQ